MVVTRLMTMLRGLLCLTLLRGAALVAAVLLFVVVPTVAFDDAATATGTAGSESASAAAGARLPAKSLANSSAIAAIPRLGDPRFAVREEATKTLEQAGKAAIVPLRDAAAGENLEITCRAIRSLAGILDTNDDSTFDAAEAALEQLEASANASAARRAATALGTQALRRWKRAVDRLSLQGGKVTWMNRHDSRHTEPNPELGNNNVYPANVMLLERWSGGSAGLVNIKRLMNSLQSLIESGQIMPQNLPIPVYLIDGAQVAPEALDKLQQSLPGLEIVHRGPARLGVVSETRTPPCIISRVEPNRAADKAGVRGGDIVVKYDGEAVTDFDHLTRITGRHKAGDRVKLEVDRDGQIVELEVELLGWEEPGPKPIAK